MIYAGDDWSTRLNAGNVDIFSRKELAVHSYANGEKGAYVKTNGEWFYLVIRYSNKRTDVAVSDPYPITFWDSNGVRYDSPDHSGTNEHYVNREYFSQQGFDPKNNRWYFVMGVNYEDAVLYYFDFVTKSWGSITTFNWGNYQYFRQGMSLVLPEKDIGYFGYTRWDPDNDNSQYYLFKMVLSTQAITTIDSHTESHGSYEDFNPVYSNALTLDTANNFLSFAYGQRDGSYKKIHIKTYDVDNSYNLINHKVLYSDVAVPVGEGHFSCDQIKSFRYYDQSHGPRPEIHGRSSTQIWDIYKLADRFILHSSHKGFVYEKNSTDLYYLYVGEYTDYADKTQGYIGLKLSNGKSPEVLFHKEEDDLDLSDVIIEDQYGNEISLGTPTIEHFGLNGHSPNQYHHYREIYQTNGLNLTLPPVEIV